MPPDGQISITGEVREEAALAGRRGANIKLTGQQAVGLRIFYCIAALAALGLVFIAVFAWATFPDVSEARELASPGADRFAAQRQARAEWVQQIVSVGQVFLLGSLLPLLGTVVGYVLGERKSDAQGEAM